MPDNELIEAVKKRVKFNDETVNYVEVDGTIIFNIQPGDDTKYDIICTKIDPAQAIKLGYGFSETIVLFHYQKNFVGLHTTLTYEPHYLSGLLNMHNEWASVVLSLFWDYIRNKFIN